MASSSRTPDPQLEAALAQFGSSTSPDHEAQLRRALRDDRELMTDFNRAAAAGELRGFAIAPASGDRIGAYDIASGVVSLPTGGFQASGDQPAASMRGALHVQDMMVRFGNSSYELAPTPPATAPSVHPMTQTCWTTSSTP